MGEETKADPAALRAYSADMRARVATTRHALGDYQMAIAAFNAAPKEEVEHTIPDRSGVIAADLDWLAAVDAQPELFAEALEAADRSAFPAGSFGDGLYEAAVQHQFLERLAVEDPDAHAALVEELDADEGGLDLSQSPLLLARAGSGTRSGMQTSRRLWRFTVHSGTATRARGGVQRWNRLLGSGGAPDTAKVRALIPGGHAMPRAEVRRIRNALHQRTKTHRRGLEATARAARFGRDRNLPTNLRPGSRLTVASRRVGDFLNGGTKAGKVLRVGGRALGAVGFGLTAWDLQAAVRKQDYRTAASKALALGGAVAMVAGGPVTATIGAAVVVGTLIYDNREAIGSALRTGADKLGEVGAAIGDGMNSVAGGAARLIGGLF